MRDRVVRGGAIAAAGLVLLAAACSSGSSRVGAGDTLPTVSVPPGGTGSSGVSKTTFAAITDPNGTGVPSTDPITHTTITGPDGHDITTPRVAGTQPTTQPSTQLTTLTTLPPTQTTVTTPLTVQYILQWKLAVDYRAHPETNPFAQYQGGPKVWSLRESQSLARNGNYDLLTNHSSTFGARNVYGWYGNNSGCVSQPAIASNTVDAPASVCSANIPGNAAWVYPSSSHMAVIQWTSLFDANVKITSGIADLDPRCGDGVRYYIDKGTTELNSMTLVNGNAVMLQPPITTPVTFGQTLNFIVDAGKAGNSDCDTTQLVITIERLQGS